MAADGASGGTGLLVASTESGDAATTTAVVACCAGASVPAVGTLTAVAGSAAAAFVGDAADVADAAAEVTRVKLRADAAADAAAIAAAAGLCARGMERQDDGRGVEGAALAQLPQEGANPGRTAPPGDAERKGEAFAAKRT